MLQIKHIGRRLWGDNRNQEVASLVHPFPDGIQNSSKRLSGGILIKTLYGLLDDLVSIQGRIVIRFASAGSVESRQHFQHIFWETCLALRFVQQRNPIECFGHSSGDAGQGVTVTAKRNSCPYHILKILTCQECSDCFRDGVLTAFIMSVFWADLIAGPGEVISELPDNIVLDRFLCDAVPC